jgi:hypothetical protein
VTESLARAHAQLASSGSEVQDPQLASSSSAEQQQAQLLAAAGWTEDLTAVVRPLEIHQRSFVRDPALTAFRIAWEEDPVGFAARASETLADARSGKVARPVSALYGLVKRGAHRAPAAVFALPSGAGPCPDCEVGGGRHALDCPRAESAR